MEWKSDTQRREVHYSAEKETNGFHSRHGNCLSFAVRPMIRYFTALSTIIAR